MVQACVVTIFVTDMEQALDFYCTKLGFEVEARYGPEITELKHDGIPIILQKTEQAANHQYPQTAQTVLGLRTDDVTATMEELRGKGVELLFDSPQPCPPGLYTAFRDPSGNVLELLEFRRG